MLKITPLFKLPVNAKTIMSYLDFNGPKTQKELFNELDFTHRVLRYTLRRMLERCVICKKANFADMRSPYYYLNLDVVGDNLHIFFIYEGLAEV